MQAYTFSYDENRKKELTENLAGVRERIRAACLRVGRDPGEVTIVAVSKKKPLSDIEYLREAGHLEFGENYVQELCGKDEEISAPVHWHMIGHLQTNKVKYIVDRTVLIHSVDSLKLARQIDKEAAKKNIIAQILIQVNVAEEESKFGLHDRDQLINLIQEISKLSHVKVRGLMTSAPFVADSEENRCYFRKLRKLFVDIRDKNSDNIDINILSMGMTNDFEVAVEEGATMVRVGTAIFGAREYN